MTSGLFVMKKSARELHCYASAAFQKLPIAGLTFVFAIIDYNSSARENRFDDALIFGLRKRCSRQFMWLVLTPRFVPFQDRR